MRNTDTVLSYAELSVMQSLSQTIQTTAAPRPNMSTAAEERLMEHHVRDRMLEDRTYFADFAF